ncbi:MAG: 16S rRNA (cytidine(1402)-2'-O)-methyltransferase [Bacteroidota bacterium]
MHSTQYQEEDNNLSSPSRGTGGKLYLVPTPIGNLKDITLRALELLKEVDLILAEDTRNTSHLLNHYGILKPLTPYHQHNEHKVLQHLVNQLLEGKKIALVTDAGTPGISDPAFLLVRECVKTGVHIECLPGATAFVPALVNSGIPTNRFIFEGFLPVKKGRQTLLKKLAEEERTIILYESPLRLVKTLQELITYFGAERQCSVSRELTKMFEENKRGSLQEVAAYFSEKTVKGEIVIIVHGK